MEKIIDIKLSFQRALLEYISKHLRLVCCDWKEEEWIKIRFYLDILPNEEEEELISCILTALESDLGFPSFINEIIFTTESFEKLDKLKILLFWRNELPVF